MKKDVLDQIFIRAEVNGKWDSVSLGELFEKKQLSKIKWWLAEKALETLDLVEGQIIERKHIIKAINNLEKLGVIIYKLKI